MTSSSAHRRTWAVNDEVADCGHANAVVEDVGVVQPAHDEHREADEDGHDPHEGDLEALYWGFGRGFSRYCAPRNRTVPSKPPFS